MTIVQGSPGRRTALATLRTIPTPWTPYALAFSRDGGRLAIGGGAYNGSGGILLVDHASGRSRSFSHEDLPQLGGGSVSSLCFSADESHLVASVCGSGQHGYTLGRRAMKRGAYRNGTASTKRRAAVPLGHTRQGLYMNLWGLPNVVGMYIGHKHVAGKSTIPTHDQWNHEPVVGISLDLRYVRELFSGRIHH